MWEVQAKGVTKGTERAVTDDTVHQERGEEGEFARNSLAKAPVSTPGFSTRLLLTDLIIA
jgi:hypothetical protein